MNKIIQEKQPDLERLCREFHVERLEVFGSATSNRFNAAKSDVDFLVEFDETGIANYADCYFGLLQALETLFARPVELAVISSLRNPYFLESIEKSRLLLYAA